MIAVPTQKQKKVIDGVEFTYIISNRKKDLLPYQYEKIRGMNRHIVYGQFTLNGQLYWAECVLPNEALEDVPFVQCFIENMVSKEIKKIKQGIKNTFGATNG